MSTLCNAQIHGSNFIFKHFQASSSSPIGTSTTKPGNTGANAGVSISSRASREDLLRLLGKFVKSKKPRLASNVAEDKCGTSQKGSTITHIPEKEDNDFSTYHESQLVSMLKGIGLDTSGQDKTWLVKNCRTYKDLSTSLCRFQSLTSR